MHHDELISDVKCTKMICSNYAYNPVVFTDSHNSENCARSDIPKGIHAYIRNYRQITFYFLYP